MKAGPGWDYGSAPGLIPYLGQHLARTQVGDMESWGLGTGSAAEPICVTHPQGASPVNTRGMYSLAFLAGVVLLASPSGAEAGGML